MQKVATSHEDLIHDVQLDYYGKRMATCSDRICLGRSRPNLPGNFTDNRDLSGWTVPTPDFITRAASASLVRGETFYTHQRGIPVLRQALADYHLAQFGKEPQVQLYRTKLFQSDHK